MAAVSSPDACSTGKERYALIASELYTLACAQIVGTQIINYVLCSNAQLIMSLTQEALIRREKTLGPNPRPKL